MIRLCTWAMCALWLGCALANAAPMPGKVVAVVYDNSGSMAAEFKNGKEGGRRNRWVYANYAMQFLAASLGRKDELVFVPMHDLQNPTESTGGLQSYSGSDGLKKAVDALQEQKSANHGTPYAALGRAISSLKEGARTGRELWLVVITDGEFEDVLQIDADAKWLRDNHVNVRFILIGAERNEVAEKLVDPANILAAGNGRSVTETVARLAESLNGFGNLKPDGNARELTILAPFPLRRVLVLRQDSANGELEAVRWGEPPVLLGALRKHDIRVLPDPYLPARDLPTSARVYHLDNGNEVLPANKPLKLAFGAEVGSLALKILPEVAADYSLVLLGAGKQEVTRGTDGRYLICDRQYFLEARLRDGAGKNLLDGRSDAAKFTVSARIAGQDKPFAEGRFVQSFDAGEPGSVATVSSSMKYPGYLYRQSEPMTVVFGGDACRKTVALAVTAGVDDGGAWRSSVDAAAQAQPVRLEVRVDGLPATPDQLERWTLSTGAAADVLDVRIEPGAFLLQPRAGCCAEWWRNPGTGEYPATLVLQTDNPRDVINASPEVRFVLAAPRSLPDKIRWYGCPFALLAALLALLWYALRLLRKARFGRDSRFEIEERPRDDDYGGVVRPSTVMLREQCSALKRWFWPSSAEVATVRGVRFMAASHGDLHVDGRDLQAKHRVPGWVFDRSRLDAPRARDRRQENATLGDNMTMKIDDGVSLTAMRYRA